LVSTLLDAVARKFFATSLRDGEPEPSPDGGAPHPGSTKS
jgi:hypothetical protein